MSIPIERDKIPAGKCGSCKYHNDECMCTHQAFPDQEDGKRGVMEIMLGFLGIRHTIPSRYITIDRRHQDVQKRRKENTRKTGPGQYCVLFVANEKKDSPENLWEPLE